VSILNELKTLIKQKYLSLKEVDDANITLRRPDEDNDLAADTGVEGLYNEMRNALVITVKMTGKLNSFHNGEIKYTLFHAFIHHTLLVSIALNNAFTLMTRTAFFVVACRIITYSLKVMFLIFWLFAYFDYSM
jgi:hypothetical protein